MQIGSNGRLGNQMFQFAALYSIANEKSLEYYTPGGRLFDVFKMRNCNMSSFDMKQKSRIEERKFSFDADFCEYASDGHDIVGYFQSEKYFDRFKKEIIELFEFKKEIDANVDSLIKDACSLHVRRTDYLKSPNYHTNLEIDYYKKAIDHTSPKKILVVSDDMTWCKEEFIPRLSLKNTEVFYASEFYQNDDISDMIMMKSCKDIIIANSSFSWWAAYLGPHQRGGNIIAPRSWFGPMGHQDSHDIYCKGWILK